MPLYDTVGINSKNGAATDYQGADVKYMGKGVYVDDLCVCYLTRHDYPSMVYFYRYEVFLNFVIRGGFEL